MVSKKYVRMNNDCGSNVVTSRSCSVPIESSIQSSRSGSASFDTKTRRSVALRVCTLTNVRTTLSGPAWVTCINGKAERGNARSGISPSARPSRFLRLISLRMLPTRTSPTMKGRYVAVSVLFIAAAALGSTRPTGE